MGRVVFICLLAGLAIFSAHPAHARSYNVEIIIFEPEPEPVVDAGGDVSGEVWNFSPAHISADLERMGTLSARAKKLNTQPLLHHLEGIRQKLVDSGYRILKTARWNQPPLVFHKAPLVSLGNEYTSLPHSYVRVYRTSLLFADVDIQLSPHVMPQPDSFTDYIPGPGQRRLPKQAENYTPNYFLSEKRRLKFKEIHYFDHPKVGAIMGVWPAN